MDRPLPPLRIQLAPLALAAFALALPLGCTSDGGGGGGGDPDRIEFSLTATSEECGGCHPVHYAEWRGSMHAYATRDPVFRAMNQIALEDTEGELDQFCIGCHAPVASRLGLTPVSTSGGTPSMKMPDDPAFNDGVQCVSCHGVASVEETHNAKFTMADAAYAGVAPTQAATAAHPIEARPHLRSGTLCGTCHDVVNGNGVAIESTYTEWFDSYEGRTLYDLNCNSCHMQTYQGPIAEGGEDKDVHRHTFAGVDQALSGPFPNLEEQAEAVGSTLSSAASVKILNLGAAGDLRGFRVAVTNDATGHALPSGTSAERRAWVHFVASDSAGNVLKESGALDADGNLGDIGAAADRDADLTVFSQRLLGADGRVVEFSWQATDIVPFMLQPGESRHGEYEVDVSGAVGDELTITATLKFRAFQPYFIAKLVDSGHLEEGAVGPSPVHEIASRAETFPLR